MAFIVLMLTAFVEYLPFPSNCIPPKQSSEHNPPSPPFCEISLSARESFSEGSVLLSHMTPDPYALRESNNWKKERSHFGGFFKSNF